MKLRFSVDQAEAFRLGIDVPKSIISVEVDPAKLPQEIRNIIADRMLGIDVCCLVLRQNKSGDLERTKAFHDTPSENGDYEAVPALIKAGLPTFESMVEAIRKNEADIRAQEEELQAKRAAKILVA